MLNEIGIIKSYDMIKMCRANFLQGIISLTTVTRMVGAKIASFIGDQSAKVSESEEWWREGLQ